jgi:hypothetical protein
MKTRQDIFNALQSVSNIMSGDLLGCEAGFWSIVSALRGPDMNNFVLYRLSEIEKISVETLKYATTGVIRYNSGIAKSNSGGCISHTDTKEYADIRSKLNNYPKDIPVHFISHAKGAFNVLGLKWDEVNPDLKGEISYKV